MSLPRPHMILLIAANAVCILGILLVIAVAGCQAATTPVEPGGRTFYVSPDGSDSSSGRTPGEAWRTVHKVNRASLEPGDTVLFDGGQTYGDDTLMPESSGSPDAPIAYGSYGAGRATLTRGIWFRGNHDLTFSGLAIRDTSQGISATGTRITVQRSRISHVGIGINTFGSSWVIRDNVVDDTGDSGLIMQGTGHVIQDNRITNTGHDRSIDYAKHGIYLKSSRTRVVDNVIRSFTADGVSSRLHDAVIADNRISRGPVGIAWFQNDSKAGVSRWSGNRISAVSQAGMYVSPSDDAGRTIERFVISGNVIKTRAAFMDLQTSAAHTRLACNTWLGRSGKRQVCSASALR
jgi:hypothetical protein